MQKIEHTKLLVHSIQSIGRAVELKELLVKSMNAIQTVLGTEASTLMLLDKGTGELNVSIPTGPVKDEITGFRIPKDKGVGGWVIQNNKAYLSNDVLNDDAFWQDLSADFETKSLLCVPLRDRNGEAYGVLQAVNKEFGLSFHEEDLEVFKILAEHISLAIQRNREYDEMEAKLEKKTLLLAETHHRLKNNLFAISALIELESNRLKNGDSIDILRNASSRLKSIAHLHSLLYEDSDTNEVGLKVFLNHIIGSIKSIYNQTEKIIRIESQIDDMAISADLSILCGLTLNELLINAYKHAFFDREAGTIRIRVRNIENEKIQMNLTDDGIGMCDLENQSNHLFVVHAFVKQMKANMTHTTSETGTSFSVEIPL
ncbi:MAG: GAF domain-containing protein [Balneola sp.]|nr:GAF domain-containing protein [Balneola sp.]MBO6652153.1 GAF domain-containing protein [Balneola sp.]MBO6712740.1 GAF domain-containing protein [Balneola sp.]MBO6801551.1 GAF domain-containing protein [Balneola sp.]MBO6871913.1 GAF domain-containing protein [Balneola sp.]